MWNETQLSWHFPRMKCNPFDWIWTWVESLNFTYRKVESSSCQLIRIAIMSQASLGCYTPSSWVCVQWHYFIMWNEIHLEMWSWSIWDDVESSSGRGGVVTIIKWKTQLTTSQYSPPDCTSRGRAGRHSQCRICWTRNGFASLSHLLYTLCSNEIFLHMHKLDGKKWVREREKKKSSKISPSLFGR